MVDEYQQTQTLYTLHPTEHAQIMEKETEGTYQSDSVVPNIQTSGGSSHDNGGLIEEGEGSYVDALFGHVGERHSNDLRKHQVQTDMDYWDKLTESKSFWIWYTCIWILHDYVSV